MTLILRPALPDDGPLLWEWRNDPAARAASLTQEPIPLGAHLDWYAGALDTPTRQILIGCAPVDHKPRPIGMVRFDQGKQDVTVSILMAPMARGLGHGRTFLALALPLCRFGPATLCATIRPENYHSISVFRANGFAGPSDTNPITLKRTIP